MKSSSKAMAGALMMACSAMVANSSVALAASKSNAAINAPVTYLISARGLSTDGFFAVEGDGCDGQFNEPGASCFIADGSNGGNGFFQLSNGATTPMTWAIELDYNGSDLIPLPMEDENCWAASGFGEGEQLSGRRVNGFSFETTGLLCDTPNDNVNYSGSYVLEGGSTSYSNAVGSGSLSIGILNSDSPTYTSQIQLTGNLGQGGGIN
jgi:hypothetical protein